MAENDLSGHRRGQFWLLSLWLPSALLAVYLKLVMLDQLGLCYACFRLDGQGWEKRWAELSFLRVDLAVAFLFAPALLRTAGRFVKRRILVPSVALLSLVIYTFLFLELRSLQIVGQFISVRQMLDAAVWAWSDSSTLHAYVVPVDALLLVCGWAFIAWQWKSIKRDSAEEPRWRRRLGPTVVVLALAALVVAWLPRVQATPYHRSALSSALEPASDWSRPAVLTPAAGTGPELMAAYRELTRSPGRSPKSAYWGSMKGSDVLFVVLETGPASCLSFDGDLSGYPNLKRLRERAFVGLQHYTTAPMTNKAIHSLLTSRYPPATFRETQETGGARTAPGLLSSLTALGYQTACYGPKDPSHMVPGDDDRLRGLGFQRLNWPRDGASAEGCVSGRATSWQQKVACDSAALSILRNDIRRQSNSGGRFLAMFLPLLSHAPWEDVTGGKAHDQVSRRRALLVYEDRWLGQVVDELQSLGRLDRTIIVVTSDHGIRTRREDPDFRIGYLDDYTFHMPLLIYAPGALRSTQSIPWLTSHIDVAPTVLDLLGVEGGRAYEEGSAIWDIRLKDRTTFFFANSFLGADAYAEGGRFAMIRHLPASVFYSDRLHFELSDMAPADSQAQPALERMVRLQQALGRVTAATP